MSDFRVRWIAETKEYQAEIAKIPGMTEKAAAAAAARMAWKMTDGGRKAGQAAGNAMVKGMSGAVTSGSANILNQLADIGVQAQMGTSPLTIAVQQGPQVIGALAGMGSAAAVAGGALAALGVTVLAGVAGWRMYTAEQREAAEVSEDMAIAGRGQAAMMEELRRLNIDLAVATGETSELVGKLEQSALRTYTSYTEATRETALQAATLQREQESLTSQVRDAGRAFYEAIDPTGLLVEGYDRLYGSADQLDRRIEGLRGAQEKQIGTLGMLVDANEQYIVAQNAARLAADRQRDAEKARREEMERLRREIEAGMADAQREVDRQDEITAALVDLRAQARATYISRLDGEQQILAQLGEELALINATDSANRARNLAAVEDAALSAAAEEARVQVIRKAEEDIAEIRATAAEKARQEEAKRLADAIDAARQVSSAQAALANEALTQVSAASESLAERRAEQARTLQQELADSEGQITQRQEAEMQRRMGAHRRAAMTMFLVSKAAALAQAVLNTEIAISNALATPAPWPVPALMAAAAGIAGAGQVLSIASSSPPTFHRGTLSVRESQRQSEVPAVLEPGEAVVQKYAASRPENQDALARMNGGRGAGGGVTVVAVDRYDGRAFSRSIRDQVRRPGALNAALAAQTPHLGHR